MDPGHRGSPGPPPADHIGLHHHALATDAHAPHSIPHLKKDSLTAIRLLCLSSRLTGEKPESSRSERRIAAAWEREIPRQRVRIWPVEAEVMKGWHEQLENQSSPEEEKRLWKWIQDIVDRRVRRQRII